MTGRALRYWVRDSRYQVSVVALPVVVGLLLVLPVLTDAPAAFALVTGPLLGLHARPHHAQRAGLRRQRVLDRPGRGGPRPRRPLRARARRCCCGRCRSPSRSRSLGAVLGGRPELAPAAVGLGLGGLLVGTAVASVSSVALPFPVPPAGSNPFSGNAGAGTAALVQQGLSLLVLAAPARAAARARRLGLAAPAAGWVLLVVGHRVRGRRCWSPGWSPAAG